MAIQDSLVALDAAIVQVKTDITSDETDNYNKGYAAAVAAGAAGAAPASPTPPVTPADPNLIFSQADLNAAVASATEALKAQILPGVQSMLQAEDAAGAAILAQLQPVAAPAAPVTPPVTPPPVTDVPAG